MSSSDQRTSSRRESGTEKDTTMQHDEGFRDPFTGQTVENGEPLSKSTSAPAHETRESASPASPSMPMTDRRMSREWDASKVPPSRFQKRAGSIFSTAGSRDNHVSRKDRDSSFHAKLKEKGWTKVKNSGLW